MFRLGCIAFKMAPLNTLIHLWATLNPDEKLVLKRKLDEFFLALKTGPNKRVRDNDEAFGLAEVIVDFCSGAVYPEPPQTGNINGM